MKRYNFFEKIYWGWKQVYYNFDEWCWVVSGKNDEFNAPITLEGLGFYDWYCMSFWYCLNHDWYKMNNKMYAYTGCEEPFVKPRDFDDYEEY